MPWPLLRDPGKKHGRFGLAGSDQKSSCPQSQISLLWLDFEHVHLAGFGPGFENDCGRTTGIESMALRAVYVQPGPGATLWRGIGFA